MRDGRRGRRGDGKHRPAVPAQGEASGEPSPEREADWEQTIQRYARGELNHADTVAFEDRVFEDDRLAAEVAYYATMRREIRQSFETAEARESLPGASGPGDEPASGSGPADGKTTGQTTSTPLPSWMATPVAALTSSPARLAASLLVGIVVGAVFTAELDGPPAAPIVTPAVVSLDRMRSGAATPDLPLVRVSGAGDWVTLLVYPEYGRYSAFRVSIEHSDSGANARVWTVAGIAPGNSERLAIVVPARVLESGVHRVHIDARAADATTEDDYQPAGETAFRVE
jgi:hypothetical protein